LLRDRVEGISIELLPLLLYTVDIYKNYETFPCGKKGPCQGAYRIYIE